MTLHILKSETVREFVARLAMMAIVAIPMVGLGTVGHYAWEPVHRALFYTGPGITDPTPAQSVWMGFSYAMGMVGFLAGVGIGAVALAMGIRYYIEQ